jgi:hypothetical protein
VLFYVLCYVSRPPIHLFLQMLKYVLPYNCNCIMISNKKVKQSHYRPGVAQRVTRKLRFPDFVTTAQDCGKAVSLTHRPPLPPGNTPGAHFC